MDTTVTYPKPCEIWVDGQWLPARLTSWARWPDGGWHASVTYQRFQRVDELQWPSAGDGCTRFWFTYERSVPADCVRPLPSVESSAEAE